MSEALPEAAKKPGIVIFVAVLNFISVFVFLGLSLFSLAVLIFGNGMGVGEWVAHAMAQMSPSPNFSYGLNVIFGIALAACLLFFLLFLWIGIGLLTGKKIAWYFQVAMSVLGLAGFPVGTILNVLILYFFFQPPVRNYFKV